jgi:hypothetical protein
VHNPGTMLGANMQHREPARPIDAYKAIIDELVSETSHSVHERSIVEEGVGLRHGIQNQPTHS